MKEVWKNFEEKILYIYEKKLLQNGTTIIAKTNLSKLADFAKI
jgi:hypothetical protein